MPAFISNCVSAKEKIMNYQILDLETYKRKSHFEYFSQLAYPYVGVTADVDITKFHAKIKEQRLPFFLSFCYCAAQAANAVPEFRQRILKGQIVQFDRAGLPIPSRWKMGPIVTARWIIRCLSPTFCLMRKRCRRRQSKADRLRKTRKTRWIFSTFPHCPGFHILR